ncbi:ACT domain-containing protein [Dyella japonica]|uniref:Amino acid-binding protein n=1 Tax=Dyella japonica A8 TaxID=1217721 RepID=A0A075K198_9GAMM|nr:ACT domain-containing protein [Dyella japonica]AIF48101.1 amino acid-binding protein [Dyella japonica A8]
MPAARKSVRLELLEGNYSVSRLDGSDAVPAWADGAGFVSISRHGDELSIVCLQERVPPGVRSDPGWRCIKFLGPFAFDETGIVLSVIQPLSEGGLGVFVVSTFDGDCLLLKKDCLDRACVLLQEAGHRIVNMRIPA